MNATYTAERHTPRPTGYPEFDSLTGYVTGQYTTEWQDKEGTRWRTTVTIVNLGKPDRGIYRDPDAMIDKPETLVEESTWRQSIAANRTRRLSDWHKRLVAYLEQNGPTDFRTLARGIGVRDLESLRRYLRSESDTFLRYWDRPVVWGLFGQTWKPQEASTSGMGVMAIEVAIRKYGPMTVSELVEKTSLTSTWIDRAIQRNKDTFTRVGYVRVPARRPTSIWGLVEEAGE